MLFTGISFQTETELKPCVLSLAKVDFQLVSGFFEMLIVHFHFNCNFVAVVAEFISYRYINFVLFVSSGMVTVSTKTQDIDECNMAVTDT